MDKFNIGGRIADDKWYSKWLQLSEIPLDSGAEYVVDFGNNGYLPTDDPTCDYEVLISCWIWSNDTDNNNGALWLYNGGSRANSKFQLSLCYTRNRTAARTIQGASCIFPLLNGDRRICFYNSQQALHHFGIQITGYKKLGTNR